MKQTITRRALVAGSVAAIAAPAKATPQKQTVLPDHLKSKFDALTSAINGGDIEISEVTRTIHAPHYRQGDLIFVNRAKAKPGDHVVASLKNGKNAFGSFVHSDGASLYLRGFNPSDKIVAIPFKTVKHWGRVVLSFRG